ncbi:MAG TPA: helix-turn-helix transcriptional regulator [Acholeplasmataceae bacterium]|jgi:transcriptional regulator with XRE-family HTH domain|nr:helix-turn-helix transcriptional regulator [Acholeplasmataceae bacterium]HRX45647.1 helix-turn-helix transcriptional regulator [Acholeplasmataceae bacterium]
MESKKMNFTDNLIKLRKQHGYTQQSLAEKLNYSDKAVSKWERGESLPDVQTIGDIAYLFHLSIDELLYNEPESIEKISKQREQNPYLIKLAFLIVSSVWLLAIFVFVILTLVLTERDQLWLTFISALPASMIVFLVFAVISKRKLLILFFVGCLTISISLLAFLVIVHPYDWLLFLLPIPIVAVVGFALPYRR